MKRALLTIALLLLAGCQRRNPLALQPLPQLQSDFNRDAAQTRVVLLISPT
jgi:hypothetical protein